MSVGKAVKWVLIFGVSALLIVLYSLFDPATGDYFPKCPFKALTGLDCPGCGSQRAVHALLNLELGRAMKENAMLVLSIPYLITGFIFDMRKTSTANMLVWRKRLFGPKAIYVVLVLIISFWILRNIKYFL